MGHHGHHHRSSFDFEPSENGQVYIDDLYVFPSHGSTVFVMDVNESTTTDPPVQPGFHPQARYEFKVHFDGADSEALTYRVSFGEADSDGGQALQLHALTDDEAREDGTAGELVLEGRTGEPSRRGNTRIWAGRTADPFYLDPSLLQIVNVAVKDGTAVDLSRWRPEGAQNGFRDSIVESIVLEVSDQHPKLRPAARIGVWCATKLATDSAGWRQVTRAGHPMIWLIFRPDAGLSNPANTRHPSQDFDDDGSYIRDKVAAVVAKSGTSDDPESYGQAVARELLPDVLPYVVGTPATYDLATRNGRTLADDAAEAMLSLIAGTAVHSGLRPDVSEDRLSTDFPYVVPA